MAHTTKRLVKSTAPPRSTAAARSSTATNGSGSDTTAEPFEHLIQHIKQDDPLLYEALSRASDYLMALSDQIEEIQSSQDQVTPPSPPSGPSEPGLAPNVTVTNPTISYQYWAHETVPVFTGIITFPISDPDFIAYFREVVMEAINPTTHAAIPLNSYAKPDTGDTTTYSGWNSQIRQLSLDQPGWKLRFTAYDIHGNPTLPPVETALFTIPKWAILSLTATDTPPIRWKDPVSQAIHVTLPVSIVLSNYPHYITLWTDSPQYKLLWHKWPGIEKAETILVGDQGTDTILYPPTGDIDFETVTVYAAIGTYDSWIDPATASIPGLVSTTVNIASPAIPTNFDAHDAYIESPIRYYSVSGGAHNFGWNALHIIVDTLDDPNFWFIRLHMQSGQMVGGVWTPGGQFGGTENGWPGVGLGDWDTADDHDSWIERVPGTNELIYHDNGGWPVPSDSNLTFRIIATITSRRNSPEGTTIQQYCWSAGVGILTPGNYHWQDVTVDPAMGNATPPSDVGANVTALTAVEIGPRYADHNLGAHTVIELTPTMDDPTLGNNVTFWVQFGDGKWVRQGVWLINNDITFIDLGQSVLGTEGASGAGDIWVPTSIKRRTWQAAAKEGNVETDDPPDTAILSPEFDVPPVDACPADDITDIHFVINPETGDEMVYVLNDVWKWLYFELDFTQPTYEKDNNYWFAMVTREIGYTDSGGTWHAAIEMGVSTDHAASLYIGRKIMDVGELQGGYPIFGSTVQFKGGDPADYWEVPPLENLNGTPYLYRTVRFRVYAVSRQGTDADGGDGAFTLQTGWPGGADHYDLTPDPAKTPASINGKNLNPTTSFDPNGPLFGGGGQPLNIAVDDPLRILDKQITVADAKITDQYLANGAVSAQKTNLAAINASSGALVANAVVDGGVTLPVNQLIASYTSLTAGKILCGGAVFTDNVYLSRGSSQPVMALQNDGMFLYGVASGTGVSGGLTSQPYVAVQSSGIGVYANATGPSVFTNSSGVTIYTVNGNLTQPYTSIAPAALTMKNGTFRLDITSSQISLDSGSNYFMKLSSAMLRLVNSPFALVATASSIKLWANWNDSTLTGSTSSPVLTIDANMLRVISLPYALIARATGLQLWSSWNENTLTGDNTKPYLGIDSTGVYMAGGGSALSITTGGASFPGSLSCGPIACNGTMTCHQVQAGAGLSATDPIFLLTPPTIYSNVGQTIAGFIAIQISGINYRLPFYFP